MWLSRKDWTIGIHQTQCFKLHIKKVQKPSQADVISLNKIVFMLAIVKKLTDKDNPRNNLSFPAFLNNSNGQIGERIHTKTKGMPNNPTESAPAIISLWGCEKASHSIERCEANALKRSDGP